MEQRISASHVVTPDGVLQNASIVIDDDGRIAAIESGAVESSGLWAVPGYVDTHCHGAVGVSFGDPDPEANLRAIHYHRTQGSTTMFASTVSRPIDVLVQEVTVLRQLVEAGELAGIHLEGPFMAEAKKGAHDVALLRDPLPQYVTPLLEAGGGTVKMVTLAVEREGSERACQLFLDAGCLVAFGHSDADAETTRRSLEWGVTISTHLFSAMRSIHHREPGPVPVLLTDPRVMNELICDGIHHKPVIARMAIDAAGVGRTALVTDAMSATGHGDGRYILGDLEVDVLDGTARLVTTDGQPGAIAGSTLTMARAFEFVVQHVGCSIPEAAQMAATTPSKWHSLRDVGSLEVGKWADVCLVNDGGELQRVFRRGELIPDSVA